MKLYIAGESFAGQHIPYISRAILKRNKDPKIAADVDVAKWNLKGVLIGNGWVSPPEQYEAYLTFAYEKNLIQKGDQVSKQLETSYRLCSKDMAVAGYEQVDNMACEAVLQDMLRLTRTKDSKGQDQCINMYDVRLKDSYPSCGMNWPPDLVSVTPYLRRKDVTTALHISPKKNTGWE